MWCHPVCCEKIPTCTAHHTSHQCCRVNVAHRKLLFSMSRSSDLHLSGAEKRTSPLKVEVSKTKCSDTSFKKRICDLQTETVSIHSVPADVISTLKCLLTPKNRDPGPLKHIRQHSACVVSSGTL